MDSTIATTVNGRKLTLVTDPDRPLLEVIREDLHLTGARFGCGEGECGRRQRGVPRHRHAGSGNADAIAPNLQGLTAFPRDLRYP
ncbi:MAG: hypothetical protein M3O30_01430 [Planctomycetota bacterium]|nr:hypothetical protein [Planctomycetota bacterium]